MQAYMKSTMPFRGVQSGPMRRICSELIQAEPLESFAALSGTAMELWRQAEFREERYAAIELVGLQRHRQYRSLAALPMYEEMIVTGAWWDLVDPVATAFVSELVLSDHDQMAGTLRKWAVDPHLWKRRSAIIAQVRLKARTDLDLLHTCIEPNLADRDFFIRKAIGWAVRAHAWTDPRQVVRYVAEHEGQLSGLSRREALKNLARLL
jgi:3-methyladenine DNA glycosylase AlkD